ncbi:3-oxoacyl-[acyl-carrier-protein] synthase II [Syntrophus gentianae]|uniref:3-oxoacyl-[acyl-carrier-protein] synthase II n=1 Tax=Syntrophus gentianae TaxID=43775 RepID=A0A1H8B589_9BACT|nr:beta-ketoacyl-[acyl-carrier-protein] synthase family protein [Syntrophus gentianae]SEM77913.1 3-oxoacyl-[acyl-carrier-protein] synthase II [Syntrophus gentianae]
MNRRVAVTGIGVVSPLGVGKKVFSRRLFAGESGIAEVASFDTSPFPSHRGAEVRDFEPRDFVALKSLRRMDRLSSMVVASARMALEDAGLEIFEGNRDRTGIILGTAFGGTDVKTRCARILATEGPAGINPILVPNSVMNAPAGHASIELGFRGINTTVTHNGTSAETALAYAAAEISRGRADILLAGGADILSEFFFETMVHFHGLSPQDGQEERAVPFDKARNGYVLGEGCGLLCLEPLDRVRQRGTEPYCEMTGWGLGSSPAPSTDWPEDPKGLILTIHRALQSAGCSPGEIDLVLACANGGRKLDQMEASALLQIFGEGGIRPRVTSIQGALGESFSSEGIRAAALALAFREGRVPPTLGVSSPLAPLALVTGKSRETTIRLALLDAASFGGTYAALVFAAPEN